MLQLPALPIDACTQPLYRYAREKAPPELCLRLPHDLSLVGMFDSIEAWGYDIIWGLQRKIFIARIAWKGSVGTCYHCI